MSVTHSRRPVSRQSRPEPVATEAGSLKAGDAASCRLPYIPALDGLRAVAVAAVLLFHGHVTLFRGGHLGVTVFFTLSGFLITSLLLLERSSTGRLDLPRFWLRRARRLVPAMLLCLPLIALVVRQSPTPVRSGLLGDALASSAWLANWRFVLHHETYSDLFSLPSPFQHFWSLGVEEQFYLAFPLMLAVVLGRTMVVTRRFGLTMIVLSLTVASTVQLVRLNGTGGAFTRAYYGTDTRAAELLVGSLLALALCRPTGLHPFTRIGRRRMSFLGMLGLGGLTAAFVTANLGSPFLFRGGFLAISLCTAAVIAAAVQADSLPARMLSVDPLVRVGMVSYGVYLFHWPLFLLLTRDSTGLSGASLLLLRVSATLTLAALSFFAVERPIRRGPLSVGLSLTGWTLGATAGVTAVALAAGVVPLPPSGGSTGPLEALGSRPTAALRAPGLAAAPSNLVRPGTGRNPSKSGSARGRSRATIGGQDGKTQSRTIPRAPLRTRGGSVPREFAGDPGKTPVPPAPDVPPGALKVVVVGDSIGNNLGRGLAAWAHGRTDVVIYNLAVPACPFSRGRDRRLSPDKIFDVDPACTWWDDGTSARRQALEKFGPDLIVSQDAINEVFDRRLPQWNGWRSPGQSQFDSWLANEYQTVFSQWASNGASVLVTNAPCGDWSRSFQGVQQPKVRIAALNVTYNALPGVTQANLNQRVCPNGQYRDEVEGVANARPDGFHFTDEAATALARNWLGPLVLQTASNRKGPLA